MLRVAFFIGQKITFPTKLSRDYFWFSIEVVKKGSSIAVPSICKGYEFSVDKQYSLTYKNNKIITSKKTKNKYGYGSFTKSFTKGNKTISFFLSTNKARGLGLLSQTFLG